MFTCSCMTLIFRPTPKGEFLEVPCNVLTAKNKCKEFDMKFSVCTTNPLSQAADLLVIYFHGTGKKGNLFDAVDQKLKKELSNLLNKEKFKGTSGETKLIYTKGKLKTDYVLLLSLGEEKKITLDSIRELGATLTKTGKEIHAKKIITDIPGASMKDLTSQSCAQALVEGCLLSDYSFLQYKKSEKSLLQEVTLYSGQKTETKKINQAVALAQTLSQGVCLTRDLINIPGSDMTPLALTREAKKIKGVSLRIHNLKAIQKMKMGAFLSVAKGSTENPPYFIEMHYKPMGKAKKKIALIGKGVTFDSGGYSLKNPKAMETMKDDMAGAAAVIGFMSIVSKLKPKVEVNAYIAATENMIDGKAQRPGDVCRAMNGKTIEVLNTDAEGRLTLADALSYAAKKKPDYMIDLATLTGACIVALGMRYTAIMGNDQTLMDSLIKSGKHAGENIWQLPLPDEYRDELKSTVADLKNIGGGFAGSITAGLFLENFVGKTKWAHLDIAGSSWTDSPLAYSPRGGTGVMVRTLADFVMSF